jgi:hypothetical protein
MKSFLTHFSTIAKLFSAKLVMLETVKFAVLIAIWTVGPTTTYPAPMTNVARFYQTENLKKIHVRIDLKTLPFVQICAG